MGAPLHRAPPDSAARAGHIEATVAQWVAIDAALAPIIGTLGVAALYQRSLHLSLKAHPWLRLESSPEGRAMDLQGLRDLLGTREAPEIADASATLFLAFTELLASLVGASLAERLLGPLWNPPRPNPAGQDTPP